MKTSVNNNVDTSMTVSQTKGFTMSSKLAILFISVFLFTTQSHALGLNPFDKDKKETEGQSKFYTETKEGYYWYKDPSQEEEIEEEIEEIAQEEKPFEPSMDDYTEEQIWDLHPDEFQELQKAFLKKAVRNPTEQNVVDYLTMQDIARQKAAAYANVVTYVTQKYERFDLKDDVPTSGPGIRENLRSKQYEIKDGLTASSDGFALIYFYDGSEVSSAMGKIVDMYTDKYPSWEVGRFSIYEKEHLAMAMGITQAPTLVLIANGEEDFVPIARGVQSLKSIENKIYKSVQMIQGGGDPDSFNTYDYQKGGSMDIRDPRKNKQ